ncbi:MAG: polymer-forming cytoskeletal protein [Deltaproteobacteria bacterium]
MAKQFTELKTEISANAAVRGTLRGAEDLVVRGRVEGAIALDGVLYVEPGGVVKADVTARRVVIAGALVGDVTAEGAIEVGADGRVLGDLTAPSVKLAPGARLSGRLTIGDERTPTKPRFEAPRIEERPQPEVTHIDPTPREPERPRTAVTTFSAPKSPHDERKKRRVVIKKRR